MNIRAFLFLVYIFAVTVCSPAVHAAAEDLSTGVKIVTLERVYLDGEKSEEKIIERLSDQEIRKKYAEWIMVSSNEHTYTFKKYVDDISPLLKMNGFFGLTKEGMLSIFNGKPDTKNVIHSFFQIDTKKLESQKQKELMEGIRVQTKDEFVQVLETFKPYRITD